MIVYYRESNGEYEGDCHGSKASVGSEWFRPVVQPQGPSRSRGRSNGWKRG